MQFNRNWPHQRIEIGHLRTQFQRFWANLADPWPHWTGARLIKVHLHSKSFGGGGGGGGALQGGSRLIEVAATAGLTVSPLNGVSSRVFMNRIDKLYCLMPSNKFRQIMLNETSSPLQSTSRKIKSNVTVILQFSSTLRF